jgi:hypothetical protein
MVVAVAVVYLFAEFDPAYSENADMPKAAGSFIDKPLYKGVF